MKAPEQIAQDIADRYDYAAVGDLASPEQVHDMIAEAIEADRAQRDIYELIAQALDERAKLFRVAVDSDAGGAEQRAAEAIRNSQTNEMWTDHIGPMLDAITEEYGT